ncbi:hypothetical protein FB451DRAFT_1377244, partial [Mycena latifolia]
MHRPLLCRPTPPCQCHGPDTLQRAGPAACNAATLCSDSPASAAVIDTSQPHVIRSLCFPSTTSTAADVARVVRAVAHAPHPSSHTPSPLLPAASRAPPADLHRTELATDFASSPASGARAPARAPPRPAPLVAATRHVTRPVSPRELTQMTDDASSFPHPYNAPPPPRSSSDAASASAGFFSRSEHLSGVSAQSLRGLSLFLRQSSHPRATPSPVLLSLPAPPRSSAPALPRPPPSSSQTIMGSIIVTPRVRRRGVGVYAQGEAEFVGERGAEDGDGWRECVLRDARAAGA